MPSTGTPFRFGSVTATIGSANMRVIYLMTAVFKILLITLCYAASAMAGLVLIGWWAAFAAPSILAAAFFVAAVARHVQSADSTSWPSRSPLSASVDDDEQETSGLAPSTCGGFGGSREIPLHGDGARLASSGESTSAEKTRRPTHQSLGCRCPRVVEFLRPATRSALRLISTSAGQRRGRHRQPHTFAPSARIRA